MAEDSDNLGPVSYLVVEFPGNKFTGEALERLVDLVDLGLIRILDLLFVGRADDGSTAIINVADLDGDGELDLAVFEGASSGMLDESDVAEVAETIAPGSSAAMLLFEHHYAIPFVNALRRSGAQLVAAGFIPHDDLLAALDATE
jgi:hypothetical protein